MTEMTKYEPGVFCWVDHVAHDMPAAQRWYAELFGWEVDTQDTQGGPPYAMFLKQGKSVAGIGQMNDEMKKGDIPPQWNNYVCVADVNAVTEKVKENGGTVTVPPMQVLDAGWLAFFVDPQGASFCVWQAGNHIGSELVNEHGALCWNELMTADVDAAKKFYSAVFGWTYEAMPMDGVAYNVIKVGERSNGGIMPMEGPSWQGVPPHWMTYFAVDDCDEVARNAADTGGTVCVQPIDIPVGRMAVLGDPDGGTFTVLKLNPPS